MADEEDIASVRRKIGDVIEPYKYTDETLGQLLDDTGNVNRVASMLWREKASEYAELVDITEAGSSRKNSDLFKNAQAQAEWFAGRADGEEGTGTAGTTTTRRIVRP